MEICDMFGNKKDFNELTTKQQVFLECYKQNMIKKSKNLVEEINNRICNDVHNKNFNKKYQIKSTKEFHKINEYVKTLNIKDYTFRFRENIDVNTNKTIKLKELYTESLTFKSEFKKVPVIYCYFHKNA